MKIKIDLIKGWTENLRAGLLAMGYQPSPTMTTDEVAVAYFNAMHRRIPQGPRMVSYSHQFAYPPQFHFGLRMIETKIRNGDDLEPHLSRKLKDQDYDDDALNDWGIHHLHLGTAIESDGFSQRTGPILFALFRPKNAYLIQVFTHKDFSNQEIVEIVHENWPDVIASRRIPGIALSNQSSNADVRTLRNGHVNTSLRMRDGTIYMPIGGGLMSNGTGLQVTLQRDRAFDFVKAAEENFWKNESQIRALLAEKCCGEHDEAEFTFDPEGDELYALCEKFGLRIKLAVRQRQ